MDYKKRNEEILEKLRTLRDSWASTNNRAAKEIEEAIPELIESEDEKIRKEIIDFATKANNGVTSILANNYNFNKWIALIEKQAEQKTVVIIPKFRVGDVIRPKGSTAEYTIESISGECYHGKGWGLHLSNDDDYELVEQKPAEWSEEDEKLLRDVSDTYFYNDEDYPEETYKQMLKRVLDWMNKRAKSLRPQSNWKPDSSMLICLEYAIKHINKDGDKRILSKLLEQLKKLKEE